VARKRESRSLSFVRRSPMTCSARPYIGDESTTRPPSFTNVRRTSAKGADCAGSTSNVCHVPSPITGSFSPEEGIGRMIGLSEGCCAFAIVREKHNAAAVPPSKRAASRRVRPPSSGSTNEIVGGFGETQLQLVHPGPGRGHRVRRQDLLISNQTCRDYGRHDN